MVLALEVAPDGHPHVQVTSRHCVRDGMEGEGFPAITWNHAFGVQSASGAVTYLGDKSKEQTYILYPVGRHLGICTPMDNKATAGSMSFVPLEREVTAIAVSNNAKHVAVVEGVSRDVKHRGAVSSRISVFRLDAKEGGGVKGTPVKVLRLTEVPDVSFAEIASIAWTPDDKHLIVQTGMPNWALCYWKWTEQNDTAVWTQLDEAVTRVSVHPANNKLVVTSGPNLLRQWQVTTDTKEPKLEKKDVLLEGPRCRYTLGPSEEFTDHCWLVQKKKDKEGEEEALEPKLLVGTSEGTLLIFRQGKLDYIMADYWKDTAIPGKDKAGRQDSEGQVDAWADRSITCCHALATGFAVANAAGFVFVFEFAGAGLQFKREFQMKRSATTDDHESPFVLRNRLCVKTPIPLSSTPDPPSMSSVNWGDEKATTVYVRTLTSNRDESSMAAVFSDGQLASFPLDDVDLMERDSNPFVPIAGGVHLPGHTINGVDTCRMQPLAVTCGTDRTIRVWDLEKKYCTVSKEFSEELLCVSIHPSGLHVVAGFTDKIRLFNVMLKDLKCFGEINVKECHAIQFSHGGHMIAVAHSATIELYETYTFSRVGLLAGHIHTVSSLTWSHDDNGLASAGMDGSVYEWEIYGEHAGQRKHTETADPVRKGVNYTHAIFHPTMHSKVLACGSDRQVRQLEQGMTRDGDELQITGGDVVQIALSSRGTMLFAAMSDGRVCVYSYPFSTREPQEYHTHAGGITGMTLSGDGKYLLTVGTDSTMYVMKIQTEPSGPKKEGLPGKKMSNLLHNGFDVGMVVRTEMQALDEKIELLQKAMQSLKEEHAIKLEMTKNDALKSQRQTQLELENTRKSLEHDVHRLDHTLREEIDKSELAKKHLEKTAMESRIALEKMYQEKLADQAHQIQEVVDAREDAKLKFEETYQSLEDKQHQKILALRDEMDLMREEHQSVLTKAADDQLMMKMAFDEHLRQMEAEYEREVEELQEQQELERADLKAVVARTKNDFSMLEKKMLENNRAARGVGAELEMTGLQMQELKQELEHERRANKALRRDMKEREEKLTEKEQRLVELKNDIRGLEKLKFLQDHQLMAMKEEIEPLHQELSRMREHQAIVDNELEADLVEKQKLSQAAEQLKLKISALEKEVKEQRQTIRKKERFVALFAQDLTRIIVSIDPSEWRQPVQALYRKYVGEESAVQARGGASMDVDGIESALETQAREWGRQRDFSERRLAAWKHKSTLVDDKARYLNNRRVAENSALITECNELRMANKELKTRILKLASELKESQYETVAAKREAATNGGGRGGGGRVGSASGRPGTAGSDASYRQHGRPGTAGSVTSAASSRQTAVSNVFTYQSRASSAASNAAYAGQKRGGSAGSARPFSAESVGAGTGGQDPLDTIPSQMVAELPGRSSSALGHVELSARIPGEAQQRPPPGSTGRLFKGKTGLRPKSASAVVPRQGDGVMLPVRTVHSWHLRAHP